MPGQGAALRPDAAARFDMTGGGIYNMRRYDKRFLREGTLMTYSQRRLLNSLLTVVAVLIALLVAVTLWKRRAGDRQEEDAAASSSAAVPAAAPASGGEAGCTALMYYNGLTTLSFALDEEAGWYWADDRSFPLDGSFVERIVSLVAGLRPQQTISPADALENYGLDKPAMRITASYGEEDSAAMYIGNQVTGESGSYYMYLDGQPETVYVIASALPAALERGIYDMMVLPELPAPEEERVQSVSVTGPSAPAEEGGTPTPGRVTILNSYAGTDGVSWRSGGVSVADNETVRSVLTLLTGVKLSRCVDYKPSDEAASLCGFDNPAAAAVVRYRDGGDQEQTLRLTVGAATADGAERYVRVDDDTTIYALSAAALAPLLAMAENGLDVVS